MARRRYLRSGPCFHLNFVVRPFKCEEGRVYTGTCVSSSHRNWSSFVVEDSEEWHRQVPKCSSQSGSRKQFLLVDIMEAKS